MASSTTEQEQEVEVELVMAWTEDEEKLRVDEEAEEEYNITESETEGTHTLTDASFSDQQEPACSDKEKRQESKCLHLSVSSQTTDHHQLSDDSFPVHGASGGGVNENREVLGYGGGDKVTESVGQNQEQENNDLDEEPEQKQGNQEIREDTTNSKSQFLEPFDQDGAVPTIMVTTIEETQESAERQTEDITESEKQEGMVPADASSAASTSDFTDFSASDLQSLKSETVSLLSETAFSVKSDEQEGLEEDARSVTASVVEGPEDDTRSVTASSVMSLFQRMQMDPLEREWLRCAALGNAPGLRQLLLQDPTLAPKKDFVTGFTALHWAAKQGRIETVDMMARSGADVNQRTHGGYTPLHLASLHGHAHIIQLLINNFNAKVNIRDYHGKMAAHYWNGNMDVFNTAASQSGGKWSRARRGQRYGQLSALLSRSRSQGNLSIDSLELTPRLLPRSETNLQTLTDIF